MAADVTVLSAFEELRQLWEEVRMWRASEQSRWEGGREQRMGGRPREGYQKRTLLGEHQG